MFIAKDFEGTILCETKQNKMVSNFVSDANSDFYPYKNSDDLYPIDAPTITSQNINERQ